MRGGVRPRFSSIVAAFVKKMKGFTCLYHTRSIITTQHITNLTKNHSPIVRNRISDNKVRKPHAKREEEDREKKKDFFGFTKYSDVRTPYVCERLVSSLCKNRKEFTYSSKRVKANTYVIRACKCESTHPRLHNQSLRIRD